MIVCTHSGGIDTVSLSEAADFVDRDGLAGLYLSHTWDLNLELARALRPERDGELLPLHLSGENICSEKFQSACLEWLDSLGKKEIGEILLSKITNRLYESVREKAAVHPVLLLLRPLSVLALESGWSEGINALFEQVEDHLVQIESEYQSVGVAPSEWTFESYVADFLLSEGLAVLQEGLADLKASLEVGCAQECGASLSWIEEGVFYLCAVEEWSADPWIR